MKSLLQTVSWGAWLANRRVVWCVAWLICLLGTSYLVGRHFGLPAFVMLGLAGIFIGRTVSALPNRKTFEETHTVLRIKNMPQETSGWDYRPRDVIRREAAFECGGSGTPTAVSSISSTANENDNVWFNFTNPEPTVEEATQKTPLQGDVCRVLTYD